VAGYFYFAAQRGRVAPHPWGVVGKTQRGFEEIKMWCGFLQPMISDVFSVSAFFATKALFSTNSG